MKNSPDTTTAAIVYRLSLIREDGDNYKNCDGEYKEVIGLSLHGKPLYVCESKARFIGWCKDAYRWIICDLEEYAEIVETQATDFTGFHGNTNNYESEEQAISIHLGDTVWDEYELSEVEKDEEEYEEEDDEDTPITPHGWNPIDKSDEDNDKLAYVKAIRLIPQEGAENYAHCDGEYVRDPSGATLNGRPVYICFAKARFIGWDGDGWNLTAIQYHSQIMQEQNLGFGAFHFSTNRSRGYVPLEATKWEQYTVELADDC